MHWPTQISAVKHRHIILPLKGEHKNIGKRIKKEVFVRAALCCFCVRQTKLTMVSGMYTAFVWWSEKHKISLRNPKGVPVQGLEPWYPAWKASMLTTYIIPEQKNSCLDCESNTGPSDLQSDALPTELSRQLNYYNITNCQFFTLRSTHRF